MNERQECVLRWAPLVGIIFGVCLIIWSLLLETQVKCLNPDAIIFPGDAVVHFSLPWAGVEISMTFIGLVYYSGMGTLLPSIGFQLVSLLSKVIRTTRSDVKKELSEVALKVLGFVLASTVVVMLAIFILSKITDCG